VVITSAKIPDNYENIFVEYSLRLNGSELCSFRTEAVQEQTKNPVFNYKKTHQYLNISDEILNYLQTTNVPASFIQLVFKVFGNELIKGDKKDKKKVVCPDQEKAKLADEEKKNQPAQQIQQVEATTVINAVQKVTTNGKTTVTSSDPKSLQQPFQHLPHQASKLQNPPATPPIAQSKSGLVAPTLKKDDLKGKKDKKD